ncbi:MAG: choice-of-anchor D domain-containing protein [Candidatus Hatepunaea meridiana]|nr:choice-of-anchor D domain-containing protein [Candidatus Hatepunaea meridiana]
MRSTWLIRSSIILVFWMAFIVGGSAYADIVIEQGSPHLGWYVFNELPHEVEDYNNVHIEEHNQWIPYGNYANNGDDRPLTNHQIEVFNADGDREYTINSNINVEPHVDHQQYGPVLNANHRVFEPGRHRIVYTIRSENGQIIDSVERWYTVAQPRPPARIRVTPDPLEFGNVRIGNNREMNLIVENIGDEGCPDLAVTNIYHEGSNEFEIIAGGGQPRILRGERHQIRVRFSPRQPVGRKNATIVIRSNAQNANPYNARLTGNAEGLPDISATHSRDNPLNFPHTWLNHNEEISFSIRNVGDEGTILVIDRMSIDGNGAPYFSVRIELPIRLPVGERIEVPVIFAPEAVGNFSPALHIFSNDPDDNPYDIPMNGEGIPEPVPDIDVNQRNYNFGPVLVDEEENWELVVYNRGSATLTVSETSFIGQNPDHFRLSNGSQFEVAPGADHNLSIYFRPTDRQRYSATLRFRSNDPDEDPFDVLFFGQGVAPIIGVPEELTLGTHNEHEDPIRALLTVRNRGDYRLTINHFEFSGNESQYYRTDSDEYNIEPNEAQDIEISYHPPDTGINRSIEAELVFQSNDPERLHRLVRISGYLSLQKILLDLPVEFGLAAVYPNPFNSITTIMYQLPVRSHIQLTVIDLMGQRVELLASGEIEAGIHHLVWDSTGSPVGLFICRLEAGASFVQTIKLVLTK